MQTEPAADTHDTPADIPADTPTPAAPPQPGGADPLGNIGAGLLRVAPTPSEHVIAAAKADAQAEAAKLRKLKSMKDKAGTRFDPARHEVDTEGNPVLTARKTFKLLRGPGRPAGVFLPDDLQTGAADTATQTDTADAQAAAQMQALNAQCMANAALAAGLVVGINRVVFKQHGEPAPGEFESMIEAARVMFMSMNGGPNLPPWAGFAVEAGLYTAKRAMDAKAQKEAAGFFGSVKGFFRSIFGRSTPAAPAQEENRHEVK